MTTQDDLEQLLWDYIYGLLEPADARALEERITSEHDVARAYAEAKQRADMLGAAARIAGAPLTFNAPGAAPVVSPVPTRKWPARERAIVWLLSSAALALVGLVGYTHLRHARQNDPLALASVEKELAAEYRRVIVSGPTHVQPELTNLYSVQLQNLNGAALASAEFAYAVEDENGRVIEEQRGTVDAAGNGVVRLLGERVVTDAKLKVWCPPTGPETAVELDLVRGQPQYVTFMECDKETYRPGETVRFRTVTLPAAAPVDAREFLLAYQLKNAAGETVVGLTEEGVGNGWLKLDDQLPSGHYSLLAMNPAGELPLQQMEVNVQRPVTDGWLADLVVGGTATPGQAIEAQFEAKTRDGEPVAGAKVKLAATMNGQLLANAEPPQITDNNGQASLHFKLPDTAVGQAELVVIAEKEQESVALLRSIQVEDKDAVPAGGSEMQQATDLAVRFFPEGGSLVAGVDNKIYFEALDEERQPLDIRGVVVDSHNRSIAEVATTSAGRGEFNFTPRAEETYRLTLRTGASPQAENLERSVEAKLPVVLTKVAGKLSAENSVVAAGQPLQLEVAATQTPAQLLVCATRGGAAVGQQYVQFDADVRGPVTQDIVVPLAEEAAGVLYVTLYDASQSPPQIVSQRLVYREPNRYLQVALEPQSEASTWNVRVTDEQQRPRQVVLGVNVVPEEAAPQADLLCASWYGAERAPPIDGERFGERLAEREGLGYARSEQLHLWLGTAVTSMPRRPALTADFMDFNPEYGNQAMDAAALDARFYRWDDQLSLDGKALAAQAAVPALQDNLAQVESAYQRAVTTWHDARQDRLRTFALAICGLSVGLLLVVAMLLTLRLAGRAPIWLPAALASGVALVFGSVWLRTETIEPAIIAARPITSFNGAPLELASRGSSVEHFWKFATPDAKAGGVQAQRGVVPLTDGTSRGGDDVALQVEDANPQLRSYFFGGRAMQGLGGFAGLTGPQDVRLSTIDRLKTGDYYSWDERAGTMLGLPADGPAFGLPLPSHPTVQDLAVHAPLPVARYSNLAVASKPQPIKDAARDDTIFWDPLVRTDENGEAQLRFALPATGRFRISIDAHGDGRLGCLQRVIDRTPAAVVPGPAIPSGQ